MIALLVMSIVTVSVVLAWGVLITVQFRRALESSFSHTLRTHERQSKQIDKLLDRFMALDFDRFKSYELAEDSPNGGFDAPEDQEGGGDIDAVVRFTPPWGSLDRTDETLEALENEERLLREDFSADR